MEQLRVVGNKRPNKVIAQNRLTKDTREYPVNWIRKMMEAGVISVENPERLYHRI